MEFTANNLWILISFVVYMGIMLLIGALCFKNSKTSSDYFLGGRSLGGWVAAMSAQASDMSGWLLMGLPGAIYAYGTGEIWVGIGLAIGTALNWIFVSKRLRRYSIVAGNSITLPSYFENRFQDKTKIIRTISSVFIFIFFLVYTASGFSAGAKLFESVFGINYQVALIIGVVIIVGYTFLGGFLAVCWTDFIQGLLMLAALMIIPIVAFGLISSNGNTGEVSAEFLNPIRTGDGKNIGVVSMISQLGWALGYFGMPHILVRFMAIKSDSEVKKSRVIAIVWVVLSLAAACLVAVAGKMYLSTPLEGADTEKVFIKLILQIFTEDSSLPIVAGILLSGILAAIMSTADSQLLVSASSVSEDIYKSFAKKATEKKMMLISRIVVIATAILAYLIALDPNTSIMGLVSNAWAGFGAAFGPIVLLSLFWKKSTSTGAIAGIISGGGTVIVWDYLKFGGKTLADMTGLYSLVVGFAVSLCCIVIFSLLSKDKVSKEMSEQFDLVASKDTVE